jgi:large subunit ribosomal protein L22
MRKQATAKLRYLRIAPRKVRLLIDVIRGQKVEDAIVQLEQSKKRPGRVVLKLLQSAIANAVNNHEMKEETLVVQAAYVDGGPVLKRWKPRAFGRAAPIRKRSSHITIVLEGEAPEEKKKGKEKKEKKKEKTEDKETDKKKVEPVSAKATAGEEEKKEI